MQKQRSLVKRKQRPFFWPIYAYSAYLKHTPKNYAYSSKANVKAVDNLNAAKLSA